MAFEIGSQGAKFIIGTYLHLQECKCILHTQMECKSQTIYRHNTDTHVHRVHTFTEWGIDERENDEENRIYIYFLKPVREGSKHWRGLIF